MATISFTNSSLSKCVSGWQGTVLRGLPFIYSPLPRCNKPAYLQAPPFCPAELTMRDPAHAEKQVRAKLAFHNLCQERGRRVSPYPVCLSSPNLRNTTVSEITVLPTRLKLVRDFKSCWRRRRERMRKRGN